MPRKAPPPPTRSEELPKVRQSQHAFERILEEIHEDHRLMDGEELHQAVLRIFQTKPHAKPSGGEK